MQQETSRPLIGVVCNFRTFEGHTGHVGGSKYVAAVAGHAGGCPVLLPALGEAAALQELLARLDGLVLTGGASNVQPHHYGGPPAPEDGPEPDPGRDGLVLPLIRQAVARGMPVLGVCRGIQELNVAFGGSLHQRLHEVPGRLDHRRRRDRPIEEQMQPRHRLELIRESLLEDVAASRDVQVNSLHGQGLDRVADALRVEAWAEDGTVEAVSMPGAAGFVLGVQWHCEWQPEAFPVHARIFTRFGEAARAFAGRR